MAKKRKPSRSRKAARPKTARRKASRRRGAGGEADPMHVAAALLVLVLVGIGIYFYQANHQEAGSMSGTPPVAVEKK
jgi:hypothetical protein